MKCSQDALIAQRELHECSGGTYSETSLLFLRSLRQLRRWRGWIYCTKNYSHKQVLQSVAAVVFFLAVAEYARVPPSLLGPLPAFFHHPQDPRITLTGARDNQQRIDQGVR